MDASRIGAIFVNRTLWNKARRRPVGQIGGCSPGQILRFRGALMAVLAVLLLGGGWGGLRFVPPRYLPWTRLDVADDPVFLVTALKLQRTRLDAPYCRAALATADFAATAVPVMSSSQGCVLHDVERISGRRTAFNCSFVATCPLAIGLAMFLRHVVEPAAQNDLHGDLAMVDHLGSFACRPIVGGRDPKAMSQHAAANAIDIAGFVLADRRKVTIADDWKGTDDKARFLHDIHNGACHDFPVVLSPDYNAMHRTHFHLDMSGFHLCR
jgi:hypothetical protein